VERLSVDILPGIAVDEFTNILSISSCDAMRFYLVYNIPVALQENPSDNKTVEAFNAAPAASIRGKEGRKLGVEFVRKKRDM
jgi:hypothetical protein